ncbi:MAG: arginine--tRNA ligase, partial [Gammaproteobacteria bacterium]
QDRLEVLLVQFANLWRNGEKVQMSTRSGQFVTLQELVDEVGVDAARFFYIMRKSDQHLDFDLTLAASKSNENPVYYIQYAHARICSVFEQLAERGQSWDQENGLQHLVLLTDRHEKALIEYLQQYPETVFHAAERLAPHLVANYLRECAQRFHTYYNALPFIVDDINLRDARLALIAATRQVIRNGLALLAISAPDSM